MSTINTGKVITGGLLAGLVFNVLDFISNMYVMAADFTANMTRLNLDPAAAESGAAIFTWVVVDFILGLVVVYLYAGIRPRFGPGPKTAIIAAVLIWLPITMVIYGFTRIGMFSMAIFAKSLVLSLITMGVGAVAGAWAYKEA